ncbi:MAG TPA: S-layer glycoprotein N-glycosyltransferase AglJ [Archaeoglobus profundus]|nr:S-layer glycoprotein N-glycosyltransferase AglJ [Archaeoglobus profundus]
MNVCILIPTLNEEKSIGEVIDGFLKQGFKNILVIDGNSVDRTREIAKSKGAKVVVQTGKGKGQAIIEAFQLVDSDIVVIIDGDGTYLPEEVHKLLEPIKKGIADHVVGNRLVNYEKGAFTRLNLFGNKLLNLLFRMMYGVDLHDILSGYRALTREVYKNIELKKHGFEIEAELTVETLAKGFRIVEVPVTYRKREGTTKLKPLRDGFKIALTMYSLLKRYSPARYFYFMGALFILIGIITGSYVIYDWFRRITHYLLAILTTLFIISGLQMIIFGLISELMYRTNVEIRKELINVRNEMERLRKYVVSKKD